MLVPGRLVGVEVSGGGPHVDGLYVTRGRTLERRDVVTPAAVLEAHFADHYDLPDRGSIGLPGGARIRYVGAAYSPEYFMVTTESGGLLAEANFAVVFAPLRVAQELIGAPGMVNDLVVRMDPGVDRATARSNLAQALHAAFPSLAATVSTIDEDPLKRFRWQSSESSSIHCSFPLSFFFADGGDLCFRILMLDKSYFLLRAARTRVLVSQRPALCRAALKPSNGSRAMSFSSK